MDGIWFSLVILNQRKYIDAGELRAAVEKRQLDRERRARNLRAELPQELHRRRRRPAGREKVVANEHSLPGAYCVNVNL